MYKAAIIGTGRIGFTLGFDKKREQPASHTMALLENKKIRLIAGVDSNPENLAQWARFNPKAKVFDSTQSFFSSELVKNPETKPDIITVAVNEYAHLDCAINAIKAKPRLVILEKPVAVNTKEAALIQKASKKYKVPVMINHERRFAEDYNAARAYITKIGDIQYIKASLFSGLKLYDPKAQDTGGYSLIHDGTHLVDIVQFLAEAVEKKNAKLLAEPVITGLDYDKKEKKVVRSFCAHYSTKHIPQIDIFMSGKCKFFGFEVEVLGTTGRICIGNGYAKFYSRQTSPFYTGFYSLLKDKKVKVPAKTLYFSNMIKNAVDFLDGRCELKSDLTTGINALEILEEMKECF